VPDYQCANCETVWFAKVQKNPTCPKLACNNQRLVRITTRNRNVPRKLLSKAVARVNVQRAAKAARVATFRTLNPINYEDKTDYADAEDAEETKQALAAVDDAEMEREVEDADFVPTSDRWNFVQRLTTARMAVRVLPQNWWPLIKDHTGTIAGPVDGERQVSCGAVIGRALGLKSISAWGISNQMGVPIGRKWFAGNKDTAEWCHLVGVSLGGRTVEANLAAASFCANTFMGVIEKEIQGRTDLDVTVEVVGSLPQRDRRWPQFDHIADWIVYTIGRHVRPDPPLVRFVIDARIHAFSVEDADDVAGEIKQKVPNRA
jgi:hypothetical protein